MLEMIAPAFVHGLVPSRSQTGQQLPLSMPVVLWAARRSSRAGGRRLFTNPNMFTLIALGSARRFYSLPPPSRRGCSRQASDARSVSRFDTAAVGGAGPSGPGAGIPCALRTSVALALCFVLRHRMRVLDAKWRAGCTIASVHVGDRLRVRPGERVLVTATIAS
jgi:Cu+-exporting ATPase